METLDLLRRELRAEHIDIILFTGGDPHGSEYVAPYWQTRQWISGFTGSAGTVAVSLTEAVLWTDSRYFLQAEQQLPAAFTLLREGVAGTPTVEQWCVRKLSAAGGTTVAVDGRTLSAAAMARLRAALQTIGATLRTNYDAARMLWRSRPALPFGPIRVHPIEYAGESVAHKLARVRASQEYENTRIREYENAFCPATSPARRLKPAPHMLVSDLMCVAWLLNLRGEDVRHTPVFYAFLYIGADDACLYCHEASLSAAAREQLQAAGVRTADYDAIWTADLRGVAMDAEETCGRLAEWKMENGKREIISSAYHDCGGNNSSLSTFHSPFRNPVPLMKAVKNAAEIAGFRRAHELDGLAMRRWLAWLPQAVATGEATETSVADELERLRREAPECFDLSFDTIAGYGPNGAIVHYNAGRDGALLQPRGLLLVDSGGQYTCGTTDVTRTIALGPLTDDERRSYTLVLRAHIAMATVQFPAGTTGHQLDAVARQVLWRAGEQYLHGTGHGVGSVLSVHEGPQRVALTGSDVPLVAGMTITNEPGLYRNGAFGIRIENQMLVVPAQAEGFLRLEPLTRVPIDTTPIVWGMLNAEERRWVEEYNEMTISK